MFNETSLIFYQESGKRTDIQICNVLVATFYLVELLIILLRQKMSTFILTC
jgi:hypothetical protein